MNTAIFRVIHCTVGNDLYSLDMSWVRSIRRVDGLEFAPPSEEAASSFVGWLSERIPVFSLAKRLGYQTAPTRPNEQQRIILLPILHDTPNSLDTSSELWGLLVDRVSQVVSVPRAEMKPLPRLLTGQNYFRGIVKASDRRLSLLLSPAHLYFEQTFTDTGDGIAEMASPHLPELATWADEAGTNGNARHTSLAAPTARQIVLFATNRQVAESNIFFALSFTQVLELLDMPPITRVPMTPPFVVGLVDWRDRPVPIIDLSLYLGMTDQQDAHKQSRLLIARSITSDMFVGFPVTTRVQSLRLPVPHQPIAATFDANRAFIKGVVDVNQQTVVIPEIQQLFI